MKSWCVNCNKEKEMTVIQTLYNRGHEKKVEGECATCGEPTCRIFTRLPRR